MKNYVIIGASSGIGKHLSSQLISGHKVWGTYHTRETHHPGIQFQHYDATGTETLQDLPEVIDGLAYCPGVINLKPFHRFTEKDFLEDYKIQVLGAIKTIQQLLPNLKKAENPSVVFFSTVAVQTGFGFHSMVSSSKGALEGLTRALAAEYAPKIRFNCIAPGLTQTNLSASLLSTEVKIKANAERNPMKRIGMAEDIAHMANYLLSDKSTWVTGQIFHVDGGMSVLK